MASADTSIFTLLIGGHGPEVFRVLEFTGEEGLSNDFVFKVKVVAHDLHLKYDDTIGNSATLVVKGMDYAVNHHGMVTQFNQVPNSDGTGSFDVYYEFTIEPHFKYMTYKLRSRIFQNLSTKEIVEQVLADYGDKDKAFRFEAKFEQQGKDYPKREFTVQYNETDWDFTRRLLEDEGIYYFWSHEGDRDVLVMANRPDTVKPLPNTPELPFAPEAGLGAPDGMEYVDTLERTVRFVTGRATIKDYNYRTPEVTVMGRHETEGPGEYYHFGDHVKTTDEAARKARIRAEMFASDRETFKGTGIFRSARPGYRFKLTEAAAEGFGGEYLLTQVFHAGGFDKPREAAQGPTPRYRCTFEAIPAATPYRPPLDTPKPRINGILTALVDGQKDKYAYIDEEGRYKVKLFFDLGDGKDGNASKAIRLAQPYAGTGYGMHFPLHTGTEVAIGFVDGDVDRPIGLGAVPNPSKGSPVKAGNKSQNMMKSHAGNSVLLEDKEGKTGVFIGSTGGHRAALNDDAGSKGITLSTSGSNSLALDDTNQAASLTTKAGHSVKLDDAGTKLSITTKDGHKVILDDGGKKITIADAGGKNNVVIDAAANSVSVAADAKITLTAKDEIGLVTGSSSLSMKSDGTIALSGKAVTITGSDSVTVGGKTIALNGQDKVSATSAKEVGLGSAQSAVAVKPDGVSTSGPKLSASAIGIHEIGGALIKIG